MELKQYCDRVATDEELVQFIRLRGEGGTFGPGIGRIESMYYRLNEADLGRIEAEYDRRYPNSGRDSAKGSSGGDSLGGRFCLEEESPKDSGSPRGGLYVWFAGDDGGGCKSQGKSATIGSPRGGGSPRTGGCAGGR